MKYLVILILAFYNSSFANEKQLVEEIANVWSRGDILYLMEKDPVTGSILSKPCLEKKGDCAAFQILKKKESYNLDPADLAGGKNPGAVICKKNLKATVLILEDNDENENAFCKFSDGSLLSVSALIKK